MKDIVFLGKNVSDMDILELNRCVRHLSEQLKIYQQKYFDSEKEQIKLMAHIIKLKSQ